MRTPTPELACPRYPAPRAPFARLPKATSLAILVGAGVLSGLSAQADAASSRVFEFKLQPGIQRPFQVAMPSTPPPATTARESASALELLSARDTRSGAEVKLARRIVVQGPFVQTLDDWMASFAPRVTAVRRLATDLAVLEFEDSLSAASAAQALSQRQDVTVSHPIRHRALRRHAAYAPAPDDLFFAQQWNLENRDAKTGVRIGVDLNVRSAWAETRGQNIVVAVADDGIDSRHPDLASNLAEGLQTSFVNFANSGDPQGPNANHGTAVAGLVAAAGNNGIGISGVAPAAKLAGWVIFDRNDIPASEERFMDMFQYKSNVVSVQNHSWGNPAVTQLDVGLLENRGISNAVSYGRSGLGVVIVRSAGNNRLDAGNLNDDAYANSPLVIAVGAVRSDGRSTRYTNPGACLLVVAPSAESDDDGVAVSPNFPSIFTTDRVGIDGFNTGGADPEGVLADYGFGATGFSGTSAAAPQIAGLAGLILSTNPGLGYRDVQQLLVWSARQTHPQDPDLARNAAGLWFSHNTGFGLPDAGLAVRLAKRWRNRPGHEVISVSVTNTVNLTDDGLRVVAVGTDVATNLLSIPVTPSLGVQADVPTTLAPLVDVGLALDPIKIDLHGKGALIFRSPAEAALTNDVIHTFSNKVYQASLAGAAFAIVANDRGGTERTTMSDTDFIPIPAVFMDQNHGEALRLRVKQHPETFVGIQPLSARYKLTVTNSLLIEHVGVQVFSSHPRRGDVRITLVSPSGTRSVLQQRNYDVTGGFGNWTYYTVRPLYENAAGAWSVEILDESAGAVGAVNAVTLLVSGTPILDEDRDGLDDDWERARFGSLKPGPADDPDGDGFSNLLEQLLGTDPNQDDRGAGLTLSRLDADHLRISWNSIAGRLYELGQTVDLSKTFTPVTSKPMTGAFSEVEWIAPFSGAAQFFRLRVLP